MSKEEFLKIQTCVLKVNIHCEGCKQKVKKTLHKIEGVYTTTIDAELGKVTVSGNVDPATLIKKLNKNGKFAEIWGGNGLKPGNRNQINNQMKNLQIGNGKNSGNNKNPPQKGQINPQLMEAFQDLKNHAPPPQIKLPGNSNDKDHKSVKFALPQEDEDFSGDDDFESDHEFEDFDDEDDDDDDEEDDEIDDEIEPPPVNKMKPSIGNTPQMVMKNMLNAAQQKKGGSGSAGNIPVQFNFGGNDGVGKKGNGGGGKNGGGIPATMMPNKSSSGGGGGAHNNNNNNGSKKGMNVGPHGMPNIMPMNATATGMPHHPPFMSHLPNLPPFPAGGDQITSAGNPYQQQQQQYAAMMMNAQRANGNERFQPMVYARPPPAVSYMPPSPYPPAPYPYYQMLRSSDRGDEYAMFSDENTQSCSIM